MKLQWEVSQCSGVVERNKTSISKLKKTHVCGSWCDFIEDSPQNAVNKCVVKTFWQIGVCWSFKFNVEIRSSWTKDKSVLTRFHSLKLLTTLVNLACYIVSESSTFYNSFDPKLVNNSCYDLNSIISLIYTHFVVLVGGCNSIQTESL